MNEAETYNGVQVLSSIKNASGSIARTGEALIENTETGEKTLVKGDTLDRDRWRRLGRARFDAPRRSAF